MSRNRSKTQGTKRKAQQHPATTQPQPKRARRSTASAGSTIQARPARRRSGRYEIAQSIESASSSSSSSSRATSASTSTSSSPSTSTDSPIETRSSKPARVICQRISNELIICLKKKCTKSEKVGLRLMAEFYMKRNIEMPGSTTPERSAKVPKIPFVDRTSLKVLEYSLFDRLNCEFIENTVQHTQPVMGSWNGNIETWTSNRVLQFLGNILPNALMEQYNRFRLPNQLLTHLFNKDRYFELDPIKIFYFEYMGMSDEEYDSVLKELWRLKGEPEEKRVVWRGKAFHVDETDENGANGETVGTDKDSEKDRGNRVIDENLEPEVRDHGDQEHISYQDDAAEDPVSGGLEAEDRKDQEEEDQMDVDVYAMEEYGENDLDPNLLQVYDSETPHYELDGEFDLDPVLPQDFDVQNQLKEMEETALIQKEIEEQEEADLRASPSFSPMDDFDMDSASMEMEERGAFDQDFFLPPTADAQNQLDKMEEAALIQKEIGVQEEAVLRAGTSSSPKDEINMDLAPMAIEERADFYQDCVLLQAADAHNQFDKTDEAGQAALIQKQICEQEEAHLRAGPSSSPKDDYDMDSAPMEMEDLREFDQDPFLSQAADAQNQLNVMEEVALIQKEIEEQEEAELRAGPSFSLKDDFDVDPASIWDSDDEEEEELAEDQFDEIRKKKLEKKLDEDPDDDFIDWDNLVDNHPQDQDDLPENDADPEVAAQIKKHILEHSDVYNNDDHAYAIREAQYKAEREAQVKAHAEAERRARLQALVETEARSEAEIRALALAHAETVAEAEARALARETGNRHVICIPPVDQLPPYTPRPYRIPVLACVRD